MKTNCCTALLSIFVFACLAPSAHATDRIHAGQWVGTTTTKDKTYPQSNCISQGEADAMNGDVASIKVNLQKTIPPEICKLSDIKANGGQIVYTATCGGAPANVITTNYHGDSFESTASNGTTSQAKRVGACK